MATADERRKEKKRMKNKSKHSWSARSRFALRQASYSLKPDPRKQRVVAWYEGVCGVCNERHIRIGDEIRLDPYTRRWASRSCLARRDSPQAIERKVKNIMLLKHNIWLGSFGKPEGATPTSSYAEFFEKALALDACNSQEFSTFREKMGEDAWHMKI